MTMKRIEGYILLVFVVTLCCALFNLREVPILARRSCQPLENSQPPSRPLIVTSERNQGDSLTLTYGDLPGYTGWARPVRSTAAWYQVMGQNEIATVGVPLVWTIHCRHENCHDLEALFDTRAYGPAIIPGHVQSHHNGSYHVTMIFEDAGVYVVEIALAFSHVAPLATFPSKVEPMYEGYLLPGMPTTVQVMEKGNSTKNVSTIRPLWPHGACGVQDLYESDTTSALRKARWKVTSRTRGSGGVPDPRINTTFAEYKRGWGSIGFTADYVYRDCRLSTLSSLTTQSMALSDRTKHTVVFIGDSHMRKQHKLFLEQFGRIFASVYLKTNDGLLMRMPEIHSAVQGLKQMHHRYGGKIHIIFNAGLHEIAILCSQRRVRSRGRVIFTPDENFSCTEQYRLNIMNLTQLVLDVPTASLVFQSTSAGWLKWGNYGFVWEPNRTQEYPSDSHACADFNQIAYQVMEEYNVPVLDSFWLTVSRPDHREIDELNSRGKKMVHAGVDIYEVLLRKWLSLVLEKASGKAV